MQQQKILQRMFRISLFALLFGMTSAYAQTEKDSSGLTQESKSGTMSTTGQNETTSASPTGSSGSSSAAGQSASGSSAASSSAGKSGAGSASVSKADEKMMKEMAYSNLSEIETAKIALSQSKNEQVRNFAQKMIDDHTQAHKDLEQLAQSKGVTLPTEPDKKHQAMAKKLSALEGDKFDKQYLSRGGTQDHRDAHKLAQRVANRASDADLKALGAKMEPVISEHLTMAKQVASTKGSTSGTMGAAGTSSTTSSGSSGDAGKAGTSGTSGSSNSTSPGKQ